MSGSSDLSDKRRQAGKLGGLATVKKYGVGYMAEIGARGAKTLWLRYNLLPYQLAKYALVDRATGEVKAVR